LSEFVDSGVVLAESGVVSTCDSESVVSGIVTADSGVVTCDFGKVITRDFL